MDEIVTVDDLTAEVCRFLLTSEEIGRVGYTAADGHQVILPVNFDVDADIIVLRTGPGSKLDDVPGQQVAFEVDHLAPEIRSGWSVLVQGRGLELADGPRAADPATGRPDIEPWAPGDKRHWLAIRIERITGRQIVRSRPMEGRGRDG
jgi:hypothetical protein